MLMLDQEGHHLVDLHQEKPLGERLILLSLGLPMVACLQQGLQQLALAAALVVVVVVVVEEGGLVQVSQ